MIREFRFLESWDELKHQLSTKQSIVGYEMINNVYAWFIKVLMKTWYELRGLIDGTGNNKQEHRR